MAKYIANPVEVDAYKIIDIKLPHDGRTGLDLKLENGESVYASQEMTCRMSGISTGDYWVIQSDGYIYLNPKEVFERKYKFLSATSEASA